MVDPINYDVAELRALVSRDETAPSEPRRIEAAGFRWVTPPPAPRERQDEPLLQPEQRRRVLLLYKVPFDPADAMPVLNTLSTESTPLVFTWLEYLVAIVGTSGTHAALDLYHDREWITASVADTLHESLAWIAPREEDGLAVLDQTDHLLSFVYIAALAAQQTPRQAGDADG